jgi:hypothetical protein
MHFLGPGSESERAQGNDERSFSRKLEKTIAYVSLRRAEQVEQAPFAPPDHRIAMPGKGKV